MKHWSEKLAHRFSPGFLAGVLACAATFAALDVFDRNGEQGLVTEGPRIICGESAAPRDLQLGRDVEPEAPIPNMPDAIAARCGWDIYLVDARGGGLVQVTRDPARESEPRWSPNGERLAFVSRGARENATDIFIVDGDGTIRNVSDRGLDEAEPAWSPDGTRLALTSDRDTGGRSQIYVMSADGSNLSRLVDSQDHDYSPAWSPDGTKVAFHRYLGGSAQASEIFVVNADGSDEVRLTNNGEFDAHPAWSPDGNRIALQSQRDGNLEIYVMDADGGNQKRITDGGWPDSQPVWSPDGTQIAFISLRSYSPDVFVMKADGTGQTNLTNSPTGSPGFCCPDWRPTAAR